MSHATVDDTISQGDYLIMIYMLGIYINNTLSCPDSVRCIIAISNSRVISASRYNINKVVEILLYPLRIWRTLIGKIPILLTRFKTENYKKKKVMEEKQLTPVAAFEIIYRATGALQLNRADNQILEESLRVLASLIPNDIPVANKMEPTKK